MSPSKWEKQDLQRQINKQGGKFKENGKPNPTKVKNLGRARKKDSQQPTYTFPKPARNVCDTFGQSIAKVKCGKCRKKGHTSDQCSR